MPSNHLILCRLVLLLSSIFSNIGVFFNELALRIRWPTVITNCCVIITPKFNGSKQFILLIKQFIWWPFILHTKLPNVWAPCAVTVRRGCSLKMAYSHSWQVGVGYWLGVQRDCGLEASALLWMDLSIDRLSSLKGQRITARASAPRKPGRSCGAFSRLLLQGSPCHFGHSPLVKAVTKVHPRS